MDTIKHLLYDYLVSVGLTETSSKYLNMLALFIALSILVFIIDFITRKLLVQLFTQFATKSKTNFDDLLVVNKVPRNVAHVIPLLVIIKFMPIVRHYFNPLDCTKYFKCPKRLFKNTSEAKRQTY